MTSQIIAIRDAFGDRIGSSDNAPKATISGDIITFSSSRGNTTVRMFIDDAVNGVGQNVRIDGDIITVSSDKGNKIGSWFVSDISGIG